MKFSIYSSSFDPVLSAVICADNTGSAPTHGTATRDAINIITISASGLEPVCDGSVVEVAAPTLVSSEEDNIEESNAKFKAEIISRLRADGIEADVDQVQAIDNGSFVLFATLNQIYQKMIQSNLNAKHGESNTKQTSLIYDEHSEFRACWIGDDDDALSMRAPEHAVFMGSILVDGLEKKMFSFSSALSDDVEQLRSKRIWCCNFKKIFTNRNDYVTNFCRFFYWQYSGSFLCRNDILFFTLFLLAQNSFLCGGLNRNAIKRLVHNPLLSIFSGGVIDHLGKVDSNSITDINEPPFNCHAIMDRLLRTPPRIGENARCVKEWSF